MSRELWTVSGVAVPKQLARRGARTLVVRERFDSVHNDRAVAPGALHPAPFTARQVVRHFADPIGFDVEILQVVHDDVCRRTFAQDTAIPEARRVRRKRGQTIVRLFEGDSVLVAHHPAQKVGREGATGEKLGVRAAVRYARESEYRVVDDLSRILRIEFWIRLQKLGL